MARATWIGVVAGFAAGFVVACLLHAYPKSEATRHRYCRSCGEYEETYREDVILGARSGHKQMFSGPIGRLLKEAVGEHEHAYTEWATLFPSFGVPEEHPEVAARVRAMREMEASPHIVAAVEQAMRNDRGRTLALVQRILDPGDPLSPTVLMPLERDEPWPQRWAAVDAAVAKAAKK